MTTHPERDDTLWSLTVAPTIWAVHFLLSYGSASVWCAKVGQASASIGGIRTAIAVYTAVALAGIAVSGVGGYRRHGHGHGLETTGHDFDSPDGRHRFLGFATLLLAGLSAVATIFTAVPAVFIETCR
jgi:hypothetical protein